MRFFSALISSVVLLASSVNAYANPGACSGTCNNAHDPSLIRRSSDGTYFRFSTGGGIAIHTAPAITGPWTYKGYALPSGSKINLSGNTDLWAPDVHLIGSTYYLYYAVSTFGSQSSAIGLATSSTMDVGTWTDLGATGVASDSTKIYNTIDPNLIAVGSSYYLNFGSFWDDIYQVVMASTPTLTAGTSSYNIAYNRSGTHAEEGSYMFYYSGYYYLFFSRGICCGYDTSRPATGAEYSIMVCRSTYATGGFIDKSGNACTASGGTVVLASHGTVYGPGGQGIYQDPTYGLVIYYHYVDTTIGYADSQKVFGWNTITWSSGWPSV
ncbi:glycoside hydrolase family 43 protein [Cenococcum geophilum 1.58]|uniref:glycoside hydrolase family 43 protein n=1 Tax=Cenococcum geophilum 1.58 TaxID=794803 RepID=UPI00358E9C24|nr:glycoside hydrolase family 43 protein [Cenococcum geophilum 1.58]